MEYVVGPVLAVLITLKMGQDGRKKQNETIAALEAQLGTVAARVELMDKETPKRMLLTVTPVAKAVKELQEAVGIQ